MSSATMDLQDTDVREIGDSIAVPEIEASIPSQETIEAQLKVMGTRFQPGLSVRKDGQEVCVSMYLPSEGGMAYKTRNRKGGPEAFASQPWRFARTADFSDNFDTYFVIHDYEEMMEELTGLRLMISRLMGLIGTKSKKRVKKDIGNGIFKSLRNIG